MAPGAPNREFTNSIFDAWSVKVSVIRNRQKELTISWAGLLSVCVSFGLRTFCKSLPPAFTEFWNLLEVSWTGFFCLFSLLFCFRFIYFLFLFHFFSIFFHLHNMLLRSQIQKKIRNFKKSVCILKTIVQYLKRKLRFSNFVHKSKNLHFSENDCEFSKNNNVLELFEIPKYHFLEIVQKTNSFFLNRNKIWILEHFSNLWAIFKMMILLEMPN